MICLIATWTVKQDKTQYYIKITAFEFVIYSDSYSVKFILSPPFTKYISYDIKENHSYEAYVHKHT